MNKQEVIDWIRLNNPVWGKTKLPDDWVWDNEVASSPSHGTLTLSETRGSKLTTLPLTVAHVRSMELIERLGYKWEDGMWMPECFSLEPSEEGSGGKCNYYLAYISKPWSKTQVPYVAECGDIMETLRMDINETNIFKELWRTCSARVFGLMKIGHSEVRGAEKILFAAQKNYERILHLYEKGK